MLRFGILRFEGLDSLIMTEDLGLALRSLHGSTLIHTLLATWV